MNLLPAFAQSAAHTIDDFVGKVFCLDALELLRLLPDNSIDMILTSPPYDNLRTYNGFTWDFEGIARESYRVLKTGGVLVWVVGDATVNGSETLTSMRQALYFVDVCGFKMHDTMIYHRNGTTFPDSNRYLPSFEYMFVLSKGVPCTTNLLREHRNKYAGEKIHKTQRERNGELVIASSTRQGKSVPEYSIYSNVWAINIGYNHTTRDLIAYEHPAMFPEELARRHIHTWSNPDDIVLDFFMGSGTTAKMARNLGRKFIGCDLSPEYVNLALTRLQTTDPFVSTVLPNGMKQLSLFEGVAS